MKKIITIKLFDKILYSKQKAINFSHKLLPILSVFIFITIIYQVGFDQDDQGILFFDALYSISIIIFFLGYLLRIFSNFIGNRQKKGWILSDILLLMITGFILFLKYFDLAADILHTSFFNIFLRTEFLFFVFILIFFIETSKASLNFNKKNIEPPLIFAGSFLILILVGTGLLLLPNATVNDIGLIDAFFTATSAVCVTGLIVVDTATHFTLFGQTILLILFQTGALGVMTFSSFFGFFFRGSFSYENQIFMQDFINEDKISEIFRTLFKIITFTISVELTGAFFIYLFLDPTVVSGFSNQVFFSIFHSVSAFCNAGFSILSNGLYEEGVREMYSMHLVIAVIIILGGLGFPIIFNFFRFLKYYFASRFYYILRRQPIAHRTRIINVNSKIAINTTFALLVFGFIAYYILEYDNTLSGLSFYGKIVTSIFGSVTPRTAGFNTVDMGNMAMPTILIYLLLMWIGASPGSTGGGIKTTTFSVAILNVFSLGRAKDRVEAFKREITNESVRRAFAVISLSVLTIGLAVFLVTVFDPEKELHAVAFECFSAYSTVGLSLGITGDLSEASKIVIALTMFLGRVGTLTLLVGLIKNINTLNYNYPSESIFIN